MGAEIVASLEIALMRIDGRIELIYSVRSSSGAPRYLEVDLVVVVD
jgi:hypothetical protein